MKIFRNNICYVNIKDLIGIDLPKDIMFDKDNYEENEYVKLTQKKDIDYIKEREDIIDYDFISSLTDEELLKKIKVIEHDLEPYYQMLKDSSQTEKIILFKNIKFKKEFYKLDKIYYDLIHYSNNKEYEDEKVSLLLNEVILKKTL